MDQAQQPTSAAPQSPFFDAGSSVRAPRPKTNIWIIVILLGIIAAVVAGFIIFRKSSSTSETEAFPTPPQEIITPQPTASASGEFDKSKAKIKVLNGTGIAKEASFLQDKIKTLGYAIFETGNADNKNYDIAQVAFASSVPQAVKDELMKLLEDTYTDVTEKGSTPEGMDIQIITGLRPGVTRPSPTPTSSPEPTEESESSPSPSPSPST